MEMHEITKKLESSGKKGTKEPIGSANHTFKPAVNAVVPDFDKAKEDWDRTLQVGRVTFDPNCSFSKDPPSHPWGVTLHALSHVNALHHHVFFSVLFSLPKSGVGLPPQRRVHSHSMRRTRKRS